MRHIVLFAVLLGVVRAELACDLLQSTQTCGAARINRSASGGTLGVGGVAYPKGIGVHATSELPLTVPEGAVGWLAGAAGIDDGSNGPGEVRFRILSGSAVLWSSPVLRKGDAAARFKVPVPAGARRLYLQVDELADNSYDHADWVDLAWEKESPAAAAKAVTLKGKAFGLKPGDPSDQSAALRKAIAALRAAPGSTLVMEKGVYHFHRDGALLRHFHASNHDQPTWHPVSVPLVDLRDVTIDASGSLFLFHGQVQPMLIQDTTGLTIKQLSLDYAIPPDSQALVTKVAPEFYEMRIDPRQFPHRVENEWITFTGEGWEQADGTHGIVFDGKTREIVAGTSDYGYRGKLTVIGDGHYRVGKNIQAAGIKEGDVITMRHGWGRPHPGCVLYRARDTSLHDFVIHSSHGMALVAQRSENVHLAGGGVYPREGTGRYFSAGADATHFSNCKGKIVTEGCRYEGMMDDAINVHATCLRIEEKVDPRTIRCRYVHGQSYGFEVVMPGESIRFIRAKWLTPRDPRVVEAVEWINNRELVLTLREAMPADLGVGDAIENADWHASVRFAGNTVRNNRARGSLFTTPHPIVVEDNVFETIAGSAILLAGDANGWFESGACHDVLIRKNLFRNNLTSRFQFTEAVIAIFPEVPDLAGQREFYHRRVRIEDNVFETFDVPLVFAISTRGLSFTGNRVTYNRAYPAWNKPPFRLRRCSEVTVAGNTVHKAPREWTRENAFQLELMPEEEVSFR